MPRQRVSDVLTREELAQLSRASNWRGWWTMAVNWGLIAGAFALVMAWPNPLTIVLAVLVIAARQLGLFPPAAPDHVRVERQYRIAALDRAALDRLQQAGVGAFAAELQEGRDRRLQIVDQPPDDDLRTAAGQTLDEADAARVLRLDHLAAGVVAGAAGVA